MSIARAISTARRNRLKPAWAAGVFFLGLGLIPQPEAQAAVPLTTARMGVGPSLIRSTGRNLTTWGTFGSFRLGAFQERLSLIAGLDLTAYQLHDAPKKGLNHDIQGNDVLFFLGYATGVWNAWAGVGAGQMRIYDREEPDQETPHRSISQTTEAGASLDLYRAQYGKVDLSTTWKRLQPEKGWRSTYGLTMIDCLQFEIGFKLLGW